MKYQTSAGAPSLACDGTMTKETQNMKWTARATVLVALTIAAAMAGGCGEDDTANSDSTGDSAAEAPARPTTADTVAGGDDADVIQSEHDVSEPTAAPAEGTEDATGDCPLTTEDVATVIEGELFDMGCGWTGDTADVFVFESPSSLWAEYRRQAESQYSVTPVQGLGDDAYLIENGELNVLVGDRSFAIMVAATTPDLDADAAKRALAEIAVGKTQS